MRITDIKGRWQLATGVEMPYLGLGVWQTKMESKLFMQ